MQLSIRVLLIGLTTAVSLAGSDVAQKPPLGWNSFDSYGVYFHEEAAMANLESMAELLEPYGYEYFVIDNGWFGEYLIVASIAYRIFSKHNPLLAMLAVFFPCISLTLAAVEYSHIMELVSYSQHYQIASAEAKVVLETFRPVITSSHSWSHFMANGFSGFSLFLLYLMLFRTSQIPRLLMGFGLLATILQVSAVAQPFFCNNIPLIMMLPLAVSQLMLPVYFIIKGLDIRVGISNTPVEGSKAVSP